MPGVHRAHGGSLAARFQPFKGVLANRLQHDHSGIAFSIINLPQQTAIDQRRQRIKYKRIAAGSRRDGFDRIDSGTSHKYGELSQKPFL
jgi:hypothetical protein